MWKWVSVLIHGWLYLDALDLDGDDDLLFDPSDKPAATPTPPTGPHRMNDTDTLSGMWAQMKGWIDAGGGEKI